MAEPTVDIFSIEYCGKVCIVTIHARELDSTAAEELSTRLLALLDEAKTYRFVLDFASVRFMESSCIGALVVILKWLSRYDGKIAIANVTETIRFLFAVTRLDKVFPIFKDVPAAMEAVEK